MARVRCIRCQRAVTHNRDAVCDACRGPVMASRTCPRCLRHNGLLTRAANGQFLCAECCAQVALSGSGLVREPPASMDSDDDEPSSASTPHCPLHPGSELIRTRMRDGSTRWTCSERNHDIENNWALCLPECKDNHGDTSLVDLFDDGRFECRNPRCPLVQRRHRPVTQVVERKSEFCLACMDTEPAVESKCPNGHISYCNDCLPHLNPRQCGQCRMPIARAISPPPPRRPDPPRPPARRITSLCPDCRQVLSLHNNGYWECTNAACAFGRMNPRIFFAVCQDCGGRTTCFSTSAGVAPYCTNPNCTAPLLLENAPPAPPVQPDPRVDISTQEALARPRRRITALCQDCRHVMQTTPTHPRPFWMCDNTSCRSVRDRGLIGVCQDCGGEAELVWASDGRAICHGANCTAPLLDAPPAVPPPVFVAPPLSDILPGTVAAGLIMMNCSRCGTYGSLTAVSSRGPWLCASCSPPLPTGVVVPLPRAARRLVFGSPDSPTYDPSESVCEGCRATGQVLVAVSPSGQLLCHRCRATRVEPEENEDQATRARRRLPFDGPMEPPYQVRSSSPGPSFRCAECRRGIGADEQKTLWYNTSRGDSAWLCSRCHPPYSPSLPLRPPEDEDQAAAMVRLLGPPSRTRRPREQAEEKKELERKQEEEEEPVPQRRRLRHLWLYFGTGPRGVRPAQGFVDGDIIVSMREAPTMAMQEILTRERARIDVQFAMTTQESFAIVTLYQTEADGGRFSNLTIDCIFDVPLDANSFIDSENVRLRYDESHETVRYSNHAYTELFTLLARDAQLQRRTERTLRALGFTSSSS